MDEQSGRQLVEALYNEVWKSGSLDKVAKFFSKDLTGFVDQNLVTYEDVVASVAQFHKRIKAVSFTIPEVVAENNKVFAVVNIKSTLENEKQWFTSSGVMYEIEDQKIIKMRVFSSYPSKVNSGPVETEA